MWEWDHTERGVMKNWCLWILELWSWRRLLTIPWTARRSNQSILKEISPEYSLEAETPILWPPDSKGWLIEEYPDAGKGRGQEEKGTTEDEMVGWHHRLDGCEFEWTPGVGDGQGGLACCDSWGCRDRHDLLTEQQEKPGMDSVSDLNFAYLITEALAQATI